MKTSTTPNTLDFARTGVAVAAVLLAGCAADDFATDQPGVPTVSALPGGDGCTGPQSNELLLEGADGKSFRLVHIRGCGWKQLPTAKTADGGVALPAMSVTPIVAAHAETTGARSADPVAVFIDGPTGYTFAWTAEEGWKFVGYLRDGAR